MAVLSSAVSRGALGACLAALVASACLDPLPSPTECQDPEGYVVGDECRSCPPPVALESEGDCVSGLAASQVATTCFTDNPSLLRCLLGEDAEDECASGPKTEAELPECYATACPSALTDRVPGARCVEDRDSASWVDVVTPEEIAARNPPSACMCRSPAELARCDGRGVVVGAFNFGGIGTDEAYRSDAFALPFAVESPSGRLGVYARVRGYASFLALGVQTEKDGMTSLISIGSPEFLELVSFGPVSDGLTISKDAFAEEALRFDESSRPTLAVVGGAGEPGYDPIFAPEPVPPEFDNTIRRFYYLEIDCVIPFYVPD